MGPNQILANVGRDVVFRQRIDNPFQSSLILTADDNRDPLFEEDNRLTGSKPPGWRDRLHNMPISEDPAKGVQVVGFIAGLRGECARFELFQHPVGVAGQLKHRRLRATADWVALRR
jgi:hypothetical protein